MDPQKITELANLLRKNGDKILSSEFTLTLSGPMLRALNDSFTLIADSDIGFVTGLGNSHHQQSQAFQVVKPINAKSSVFSDLQLLHDFVQKTTLLKLNYFPSEHYFEGAIDISKFRALRRLEVHKINICQVVGIQGLRSQLQILICVKGLNSVEDIITRCGGDNSNGFVWNELQSADFSYNNLQRVDTALEFAQHLQHLNLRHNKLTSVAAIKWLPHLKTLDLSYNCLTHLPLFHAEACKRLQLLNISNNYVEELHDMTKLDLLTNLDLSDNCLLEHSQLLPLSVLIALTTLNLQGNPLACNPKHRLATAQYLHKNTSTVKFVLDFEPLSKAEKAVTGIQQLPRSAMSQRLTSSYLSINSARPSLNTPASSVGSIRSLSIRGKDSSSEAEPTAVVVDAPIIRRRSKKPRNVEIPDHEEESTSTSAKNVSIPIDVNVVDVAPEETADGSHLETKKQIETLRLKYGNEWLQSGNAELMLGLDTPQPSEQERNDARQQFNEYLGEFSTTSHNESVNDTNWNPRTNATLTPTSVGVADSSKDANTTQQTVYESCENSTISEYQSVNNTLLQEDPEEEGQQRDSPPEPENDKHKEVLNLFARAELTEDEEPVSDEEPDEKVYIVCHEHKASEPFFLTISSNYIREKDAMTERTKTKWSLKVLESCERIKSNTLRINFDTMQKDKQERTYSTENALCQEIEKKLRDILSQRDLSDMKITVYKCIICHIKFSRESKHRNYNREELRCPECQSVFVAEVNEKPKVEEKISPALIVEESPVTVPLVVLSKEDTQSIVGKNRLIANNTTKRSSLMPTTKSSANSLNGSSSCSKITNSQCSFDSNQSVVGSTNTDRDLEFRANESDVDIISNPSQSSIEVLDPNIVQSASRKTSEERRISQMPNLQTIDDHLSQSQSFIEREFGQLLVDRSTADSSVEVKADPLPKAKSLAQVQLTESSSSGSVTDSICTTYEQQGKAEQATNAGSDVSTLNNMLAAESISSAEQRQQSSNNDANGHLKKAEDAGLSSMFGALFQSTNMLMSSSKKLIETEASGSGSGIQPYKFNYSDYNDIDHRLKLYFYQTKFKEVGEHFKWLAKGRIYNEQTKMLRDGILVISTCKCYLMEAYAPPQDDVSKWLRQVVSATINRLTRVQCLPWKLGLSFTIRDWGNFALLLQDMLRTDSLLLYLADNPLPSDCEVIQDPVKAVRQRLSSLIDEPLKVCSVLTSFERVCGQDKRTFDLCTLLSTDKQIHICGGGKFNWLSASEEQDNPIELSLTQEMSNLVEVERISNCDYNINFLDETENLCELWQLHFETPANADVCLNTIGTSWEQLFGVPFSFSGT